MDLTSSGRWPGSSACSVTTLTAAETAPQLVWPSTMSKRRAEELDRIFEACEAHRGLTKLPATRTTKISPGPWSKSSSGDHAAVGAAQDRRDGILRGHSLGAARREVLASGSPAGVAGIALHQTVERLGGGIAFGAFAGGGSSARADAKGRALAASSAPAPAMTFRRDIEASEARQSSHMISPPQVPPTSPARRAGVKPGSELW